MGSAIDGPTAGPLINGLIACPGMSDPCPHRPATPPRPPSWQQTATRTRVHTIDIYNSGVHTTRHHRHLILTLCPARCRHRDENRPVGNALRFSGCAACINASGEVLGSSSSSSSR